VTGYAVVVTADLSAVGAAIVMRAGVVVWAHRDAVADAVTGMRNAVAGLPPLVGPVSVAVLLWVLEHTLRPHGQHRRAVNS
jgi:hypothetical protein